jgi:hypothetical protein
LKAKGLFSNFALAWEASGHIQLITQKYFASHRMRESKAR